MKIKNGKSVIKWQNQKLKHTTNIYQLSYSWPVESGGLNSINPCGVCFNFLIINDL